MEKKEEMGESPKVEAEKDKPKVSFIRPKKRLGAAGRRGRIQQQQKKDSSSEDSEEDQNKSDEESGQEVVKIKRPRFRGGIVGGATKNKKFHQGYADEQDSSSSDSEKAEGKSSLGVAFKGSGVKEKGDNDDQGATATLEIDTESSRDARAIEERAKKVREGIQDGEKNPLEDKVYRGMNSYAKFIEKKDSAAGSSAKMSTGPQRAPSNIR